MSDVDARLRALVAADPVTPHEPDVPALRRLGRRRLLRRRAGIGAGAVAVAAALVAATLGVLPGEDPGPQRDVPAVDSPSTSAADPTTRPPEPERDSIRIPGGLRVEGEYEQGQLLGDVVEIGRLGRYREVLYAARGALDPSAPDRLTTHVAVGVRLGDRILRILPVAWPSLARKESDGVSLYDGYRIDMWEFRHPYYRLFGLARGSVEVTVTAPDGMPRPATTVSTEVLPGWTVFVDERPWDPSWDVLKAAPVTVDLGDGRTLSARERSWTG